jgi:hypothetical protein
MTVLWASAFVLLIFLQVSTALLPVSPCFAEETSPQGSQKSNVSASTQATNQSESEGKKKEANLSDTQPIYLGNKFSQKYHLKGCHFAQIADPGNIFLFASCKEAIKSNYRPCNWCLPTWQKFVKGQIIGLPKNREADAKKSSSQ